MVDEPLTIRQALNLAPDEMLRYLGAKDYRATVNWAEMWHDDHVRSFTVAKVARYDLLETIRGSIHDAWEKGVPLDQWREQLIPELQKKGWWGTVRNPDVTGTTDAVIVNPRRLENIFVTNFRMASAAAQWKRFQAGKTLMPFLRYRTRGDEHVRFSHARLNNIILPVDHPFWQIYFPPNDWGCRCYVVALNQRMLDRLGLKVTPDSDLPELAPRLFWRPGASKPEIVPGGVGPGFGYNPGTSYMRSFVPPPLDTALGIPTLSARGAAGPVLPLPTPRRVPRESLLDPDISDDDAIRAFTERISSKAEIVDDVLIVRDMLDDPICISPEFFRHPDGTTKLRSDRRKSMLLLADALIEPDEIWWTWERVAVDRARSKFRWRLTRRYVARYDVDGEEFPLVIVLQVGRDGWHGVSAFVARSIDYLEREQVRGGVLAWRRAET